MHLDPVLPSLAAIGLVALTFGLLCRRLGQPPLLGYLAAGILLGPHALGIVESGAELGRVGHIGVVLLLFFLGMEMHPQRLVAHWRVMSLGTLVQIGVSVACVLALGTTLGWPVPRSILLGFVISISSTAVVLRLLARSGETETRLGEHVTGILLAQDIAIVPMLIGVGLMSGDAPSTATVVGQLVGIALLVFLVVTLVRRGELRLGLGRLIGDDHELQVFAALMLVFGFGLVTGVLGLSTALGAFVAGMVVTASRETRWVLPALEPFRVVFLALFFVSVGMMLDLSFVRAHWWLVLTLTALALITNTIINAVVLRMAHHDWRTSLYGGALLAQIGEFSYLLIEVGRDAGLVRSFAYQATVATITLSLLISPFWVAWGRRIAGPRSPQS